MCLKRLDPHAENFPICSTSSPAFFQASGVPSHSGLFPIEPWPKKVKINKQLSGIFLSNLQMVPTPGKNELFDTPSRNILLVVCLCGLRLPSDGPNHAPLQARIAFPSWGNNIPRHSWWKFNEKYSIEFSSSRAWAYGPPVSHEKAMAFYHGARCAPLHYNLEPWWLCKKSK